MNMASQSHVTLTHVCWWSKSHDDVSVQWELEPVRNWVCQTVLILKSQRTEMGLEINSVKSSCWDKCLHRITQTVQHNRPKCPLSSGHHLWDTFCPLSLLWTSHHQLFPSMLLFPVACYSLPLVVVLSWWSRTYKQIYVVVLEIILSTIHKLDKRRIFIYVCIKRPRVSFLLNMVKYPWKFPQRLKDALLFIDSSSYCKCLIHFCSGGFHYVKLVILFMYLQQGGAVFTCLFVRWYKTRVMIPVKSVEGCLLSIKAETSRNNRTFLLVTSGLSQRKWSMRLTHRLNIKALTGMFCCYTTAPPVGQKVEKQPLLCTWSRNENVPLSFELLNSKLFKCV